MRFLTLGLCLCVLSFAGRADAATLTVNAGGDLQAAINAAKPGDTILLQAGAVFTGNYELPVKGGTSYITIRSSAPDSALPPDGTRITPAYTASMAKLRSDQFGPALRTVGPAAYWRVMFLEFMPSISTAAANLVELGASGAAQNTLATVPHHLIVDRCYLHGDPAFAQRRGIALNSGETQIINSHISDIKGPLDTQAIAGWNGPGPYLIENNHLEAGAENILFGGADPSIVNLVPSNITIRRNLITKPLAWMTASWTVKNLVEFKNADTVLIEGNTIENNWAAGQQGYSIVLTPRNQDGTAPWTVVQNITVRSNVIRHVAAVFNIFGYDNNAVSRQTNNIVVANNLIYDVSTAYSTPANPANGWVAIIGNQPKDVKFDHNTIDNNGNDTFFFYEGTPPAGTPISGVVLTSNAFRDNLYGIFGNGSQEGSVSLAAYAPGAYVQGNAIAGGDPKRYPVGNEYPTMAQWLADFVNPAAANYQLVPTSLSKGAGADGKDIGVDFAALNAAMSATPTPAPAPTPTPTPTPAPTPPPAASTPFTGAPIALPGRIEAENYNKGGEGLAYHDTTAGNSSGVYRTDDVDIRATTDTSGAYNVKSVRAGEWLAYSVNVAAAGSYAIDFRVASSGTGGTVHVTLDGVDVTGAIALPDTGGWGVWKTVTKNGVTLPAGTHVLKLVVDANGSAATVADINWINVSAIAAPAPVPTPTPTPTPAPAPAPVSTPYTGTAVAMPGRIETENYDRGGEGFAYHDTTAGNSTGAYRTDDVDIRATTDAGGGYNVKSVRAGEWLAYSVSVPAAGTYSIDVRVASLGGGGTIHFTVDGVDVTGAIALPDTGGWNTWQTATRAGVKLPAGSHIIKLVVDANGSAGTVADINWFAVR